MEVFSIVSFIWSPLREVSLYWIMICCVGGSVDILEKSNYYRLENSEL